MAGESPARRIARLMHARRSFLICGHIRPDADCIGSQLALARVLSAMGKQAVVWLADPVPEQCRFLPGSAGIRLPDDREAPPGELAVALDTPNPDRLGRIAGRVLAMPAVVNIDHHPSNIRWGDPHWVDPGMAATAEFIYLLAGELGVSIDRDIAVCLYAGIVTDTGRFSYDNTTPFTHRVAAELVERGADPHETYERLYASHPPRRMRLLARVLEGLRVDPNGAFARLWIRRCMYAESGAGPEDADGFINFARDLDGVRVAALFEEMAGGGVRVSLRSRDAAVDVNELAARYGGGGHPGAAGANVAGEPEEIERRVCGDVRAALARAGGTGRDTHRGEAGGADVA
jgi:phosphoesterase RecJ-like protein